MVLVWICRMAAGQLIPYPIDIYGDFLTLRGFYMERANQ